MQEAFEILDWGKSASLKSLLGGKEVLLDKAMLLYTHSVQKTLTHFTWYDKAPRDAARSVEMIAALSDVIPIEITREARHLATDAAGRYTTGSEHPRRNSAWSSAACAWTWNAQPPQSGQRQRAWPSADATERANPYVADR